MPSALSNAQKRYLRGLAHELKAVILIGAKGVTAAVLAELDGALNHHKLVKVKLAAEDRDTRDAWIATMAEQSRAALVGRIGHTAIVYRRREDKPLITLPNS